MNQTPHRRTPSFSSSLLDAIYRSIDGEEAVSGFEETAVIKKQSILSSVSTTEDFMIETWKEKRCRSRGRGFGGGSVQSKCSSSSDSTSSSRGGGSYGGFFSSSSDDTESKNQNLQRNRAILDSHHKAKSEGGAGGGGFTKTKLRAKKIYGELKKVKQPISPGGRIASFLNSIFSSGNGKKVKMCSIGGIDDVSTTERKSKSGCSSSVTSFSSSCLSKTPRKQSSSSSRNGGKRSVRFYPVSVIVDEDSRPCGHKSIYEDDPGLSPFPVPRKSGKISSSCCSSDVLNGERYIRRYQKKKMSEFDFRGFHSYDGEDDSDEDGESCSSSDLFELDHLIEINGRLREELPVYETTNFKTNQAIANEFIM